MRDAFYLPALLAGLAALSALVVRFMITRGTLDYPGERSSHSVPTPKGGGWGIVAAAGVGAVAAGYAAPLAPVILLGLYSYYDDRVDGPFWAKFAVQAGTAAIAIALLQPAGLALPGFPALAPARFGLLCLCWALYTTNAVNFMDGLNGLAAGCSLIAAAALAFGGWAAGAPGLAWLSLPLAAGVAGFLPFNFPRARIFMGDTGSQPCGLLLALFAVKAASIQAVSLVVPLAIAPLLLDVGFTLLRRARAGARLTQAHRGHLYQVANRAGMEAARVTLVYWTLCGWGALCGLSAGRAGSPAGTLMAIIAASVPCGLWGLWVTRAARRAGLGEW